MANNVTVNGATIATQDVSSVHFQKTKATGTTVAAAGALAPTTSSASSILAANANRQTLLFLNDGSVTVEISPTASFAFGAGLPVAAGGTFTTTYTGALYARTSVTTGSLRYWEDANA